MKQKLDEQFSIRYGIKNNKVIRQIKTEHGNADQYACIATSGLVIGSAPDSPLSDEDRSRVLYEKEVVLAIILGKYELAKGLMSKLYSDVGFDMEHSNIDLSLRWYIECNIKYDWENVDSISNLYEYMRDKHPKAFT